MVVVCVCVCVCVLLISRRCLQTSSSSQRLASRRERSVMQRRSLRWGSAASTRCGGPHSLLGALPKGLCLSGTLCQEGLGRLPASPRGYNGSRSPSQKTSWCTGMTLTSSKRGGCCMWRFRLAQEERWSMSSCTTGSWERARELLLRRLPTRRAFGRIQVRSCPQGRSGPGRRRLQRRAGQKRGAR